jgi:hypothetical protein
MVPQLLTLLRSRPRARSRALMVLSPNCPAVENLEERTLLTAAVTSAPTLAILNGNFTGSYSGQISVNNNGTVTKSAVASTAFSMAISNGAITFTTPVGNGTGTVTVGRAISGTVEAPYQSTTVPVTVTGNITNVNAVQTYASGKWTFSVNLGGGVTATGSGTWTASAPQILSNFDGNYAGTYQGTITTNTNGSISTTPVSPGTFMAAISNGVITTAFPSGSGLTAVSGSINVTGRVNSTATFVEDGVTITVTASGPTSRGLQGVNGSGAWSFKANLPGGVFVTGSGTYTLESILVLDGSYAGTAVGNVTENDNGTITNNPIPGSLLSNNTVDVTISNGTVSFSAPGVPATGTGTIDFDGNITGTATFTDNSVTVTISLAGTGMPTASGNVLNGTWTIPSTDVGGGVTISGSGTWSATPVMAV